MEMLTRKIELDLMTRGDRETIPCTISSEEPIARHFGMEVLDHSDGSVDFSRAKGGLPLLFAHDHQQIVGRAERVRLIDRTLKADLRFGSSTRAQEILADIRAKVLVDLSVGYSVDESAIRKEGEVVRFMRWTPFETSVVGVAADPRAKIGRSADLKSKGKSMDDKSNVTVTEPTGEAKRIRELNAFGRYRNGRFRAEADRAIDEGTSVDQFRAKILDQLEADYKPLNTAFPDDTGLGLSHREIEKYSIVRAIHSMAEKDFSYAGFERECSRAVAKKYGREPQGIYIPGEVLSNLAKRSLVSSSDPGGGYLIGTEHLASEFIELLRAKMLVKVLGARVLSGLRGNVDIPGQSGAATEYWVGEDEAITPSDQTLKSVNLTPHSCGALTRYTRRMLLQASPDVESFVTSDLATVVANGVDKVAINGGGSNQPSGILVNSDVAPITTSGTLTWAKILEFPAAVEGANADVGQLAFLTNPATKSRLLGTEKVSGFPVYLWEFGANGQGMMAGQRAFATSNVPANLGVGQDKSAIIFGNWNDLIIGQWGPLDILSDPYTDANKGAVRIRAFMDVDIGIRHPASFAVAVDV